MTTVTTPIRDRSHTSFFFAKGTKDVATKEKTRCLESNLQSNAFDLIGLERLENNETKHLVGSLTKVLK